MVKNFSIASLIDLPELASQPTPSVVPIAQVVRPVPQHQKHFGTAVIAPTVAIPNSGPVLQSLQMPPSQRGPPQQQQQQHLGHTLAELLAMPLYLPAQPTPQNGPAPPTKPNGPTLPVRQATNARIPSYAPAHRTRMPNLPPNQELMASLQHQKQLLDANAEFSAFLAQSKGVAPTLPQKQHLARPTSTSPWLDQPPHVPGQHIPNVSGPQVPGIQQQQQQHPMARPMQPFPPMIPGYQQQQQLHAPQSQPIPAQPIFPSSQQMLMNNIAPHRETGAPMPIPPHAPFAHPIFPIMPWNPMNYGGYGGPMPPQPFPQLPMPPHFQPYHGSPQWWHSIGEHKLAEEQRTKLRDSFSRKNTITPKEAWFLRREINLSPRLVESWFLKERISQRIVYGR